MKSYRLIHQLLDLAEQFEAANGGSGGTLRDFAGFLLTHLQEPDGNFTASEVRFGDKEPHAQERAFKLENNIGRLLVYMSRYAKSYIKKALEGSRVQTAEEFTALTILLTHDDLSKSELIVKNIQEKTSGTEVIRRLLAAGLVHQYADKNDKRGKRIAITDEGKEVIFGVLKNMRHVGMIVTGELTLSEKLTLQYLLKKLEDFHFPIYEHKAVNNIGDLRSLAESLE